MKDLPIGIFDSGVGGLTVCSAIQTLLPNENILYVGDSARVPYGNKSPKTIIRYSQEITECLMEKGIKMLVIACNTATTWALAPLKKIYSNSNIPIFGVIFPGASHAVELAKGKPIGVIGTLGTIQGQQYQREIQLLQPNTKVLTQSCPLFVSLIEENWLNGSIVEQITDHYLQDITTQSKHIILGCTHYPLLLPVLQKMYSTHHFIDSAQATAKIIAQYLQNRPDIQRRSSSQGQATFLVTDNLERFQNIGQTFLQKELKDVQRVELPHQLKYKYE
jgi:glutamate racemase